MSGKDCCGAVAVGTDDDAVGVKEVGNGSPLPKELGVGDDVEEVAGGAIALHRTGNPLVGVNGHCAFFDDDLIAGERTGDLAGDGFDVGEICIAAFALRGAYGDEDGFTLAGGLGEIGHETDVSVPVLLKEFREIVLVNERVAGLESGNLALVIVNTDDMVTHFREANRSNQANISRPDNGNFDVFTHSVGGVTPVS